MNIRIYTDSAKVTAGITLKDSAELENNNMALHACADSEHVLTNRRKLSAVLNCDLKQFVCPHQTHSSEFYRVTSHDKGRGALDAHTAIPDVDALYTYESNLLLCCFTADCVPVVFYSETSGLVGVIHSGWQGAVKEITLKLFQHLIEFEQCNPIDFHVQIGPAISQRKFEVDHDVYQCFKDMVYADPYIYYDPEMGKYHIDIQQTVKKQCELAGIPSIRVQIDPTCTYESPEGFSYRRNPKCGRHLSFIFQSAI